MWEEEKEPEVPVEPGQPENPTEPSDPEKPNNTDTPETRDMANLGVYASMLVCSFGTLAVLLGNRRKSYKND